MICNIINYIQNIYTYILNKLYYLHSENIKCMNLYGGIDEEDDDD